jgi:hypothetical protein
MNRSARTALLVVGGILLLFGLAGLLGPAFLIYSWFFSLPVNINASLPQMVIGSVVTLAALWFGVRILRAAH